MKTTRKLLILAAILGTSSVLNATGRAPLSTTAIGHMCVTLLTPAALSESKALQFNAINLNTNDAGSVINNVQNGEIKVLGNTAEFAVTVFNNTIGVNQNGMNLAVENFTATANFDENGSGTINLGGTMKVSEELALNESSPLSVMVNYN